MPAYSFLQGDMNVLGLEMGRWMENVRTNDIPRNSKVQQHVIGSDQKLGRMTEAFLSTF